MNISILSGNIKRIREAKGITSYKLAKLSGVGESTLSLIESGKRKSVTIATVEKIAKALKVTPEELLTNQVNEEYVVEDLYDTLDVIFESDELKIDGFDLSQGEKEYIKLRVFEIVDIVYLWRQKFNENEIDPNNLKTIREWHEARKQIMKNELTEVIK